MGGLRDIRRTRNPVFQPGPPPVTTAGRLGLFRMGFRATFDRNRE
jgi:hypothetical protein